MSSKYVINYVDGFMRIVRQTFMIVPSPVGLGLDTRKKQCVLGLFYAHGDADPAPQPDTKEINKRSKRASTINGLETSLLYVPN
jgi:hypothetical protein